MKRRSSPNPKRLFANTAFEAFVPLGFALILLTTLLVYLPAMNGAMLWDDDSHVTRPELQSLSGLYRIWFELDSTLQYYPLLHSVFWIEHKLWGDSVVGYHIVSLLWHMLAVTLAYLNLKKLKVPGALLATAIFALHPIMVESVGWISEQKNTLSTVFYLGAMLAYLNFDDSRRRSQYLLALGLFILALLTKTATVTLPPALLIIAWWQRGSLSWRRDVRPVVPFFVLATGAGVLTSWVERKVLGAEGIDFGLSLVQRFLLAGRAVWFYFGKLACPINLLSVYPRWKIDPSEYWQWSLPLAALAITAGLWFARKWSRSPLASWLFFCVSLFPVLGFFNVAFFLYSFVADHFQYVASLGIIAFAAAVVTRLLIRLPQSARIVGGALCVVFVATLAVLTVRQVRNYVDEVTFYQTTIDGNPSCWVAHYNLGTALYASGERQQGIEQFREALRIRSDYPLAEYSLAKALADTGDVEEAFVHYREAIRLRPNYGKAHNDFGNALAKAGRSQEAIGEFQAALEVLPNDPGALNSLAIALIKLGRFSEAAEHIEHALMFAPENADACAHLGLTLTQLGKNSQAIDQFRHALELDANQIVAHHNLGILLAQSGKSAEAISHFEQEIRMNPENVQAYSSRAQALAILGRSGDAVAAAQKAIEVARSTHQDAAAERIEEWLNHFQIELRRSKDAASDVSARPSEK